MFLTINQKCSFCFTLNSNAQFGCGWARSTVTSKINTQFGAKSDNVSNFRGYSGKALCNTSVIQELGVGPTESSIRWPSIPFLKTFTLWKLKYNKILSLFNLPYTKPLVVSLLKSSILKDLDIYCEHLSGLWILNVSKDLEVLLHFHIQMTEDLLHT